MGREGASGIHSEHNSTRRQTPNVKFEMKRATLAKGQKNAPTVAGKKPAAGWRLGSLHTTRGSYQRYTEITIIVIIVRRVRPMGKMTILLNAPF